MTDAELKEVFDGIDFSQMVTADDLSYMIARAVLAEQKKRDGASDCPSHAGLYAALRSMHWNDGKLAVIDAKDLKLGVQTYSGEMLDAAIERAIKASDHLSDAKEPK